MKRAYLILIVCVLTLLSASSIRSQTLPYQNTMLDVETRVEDLLGRMSLAEKIGQMTLIEKNSISFADTTQYFIGAILSGGGGYPTPNTPAKWREMVLAFQESALDTPLAIPLIYGVDAVHGHNNVKGAVIFPHNVGLGAARNPELVKAIGEITAREMLATGIYWNYAPVLAVAQDIRWGRIYESYGEDTALVTTLSSAFLRGLQGDSLTALGTPKHFVGDGGTVWGSATTNFYQIDQGVTDVDEDTLRAVHLSPYYQAIEDGALSIMVSFSSWGGLRMHAQRYLITDVLKGEMGFQGFVVSDWDGIGQISRDAYFNVVTGINAGLDMIMVPYDYKGFIGNLTRAVETGDVSLARIDDAVRRILRVKFMLGLFENPYGDETLLAEFGSEAHRAVARQAVAESLVLLQNNNNTLPLQKTVPTIFVAGEGADDIGIQSGGWTIEWQGRAGDITTGTTLLQAIKQAVDPASKVYFNRFGKFDRITDSSGDLLIADVGIVVVGEQPYAEGRGDNAYPVLDERDVKLIEQVYDRSKVVVVVIFSGRPLIITGQLDLADAVVAAWLPGTEGAGITDVLFGDKPFTGKLPLTWYRSVEQIGTDKSNPLFPYGFGLE